MAVEDIESPPYPDEGINADALYNILKVLGKWVTTYRKQHNVLIGSETIPSVKTFPDKKGYVIQPVLTQWRHLLCIRRFRESWDHLIRKYENDWDDQHCVHMRANILQQAALLLNTAFVSHENWEARKQRELHELQQQFNRIDRVTTAQLEKKYRDPQDSEEDEES